MSLPPPVWSGPSSGYAVGSPPTPDPTRPPGSLGPPGPPAPAPAPLPPEGSPGSDSRLDPPPEGQGVAALVDLLTECPGALVLSGAGLSTESGIPDYRGPDGQRRVTPMQHGEFVGSSQARQRYWARSFIGWARFDRAEPNTGHHAITRLQELGAIGSVITQNVDGLHQRAGTARVTELHGSLAHVVCLACDARIEREWLQAAIAAANPGFAERASGTAPDGSRVSSQIRPDGDIVLADALVGDFVQPRCPRCGSDAVKPDVVFFGGVVPKERVEWCHALTEQAPALIVLGSSLAVMSGFRFVRRAAGHGIPIAIVTHGPTRGDELAAVRLDAPLGLTLAAVAGALAQRGAAQPFEVG